MKTKLAIVGVIMAIIPNVSAYAGESQASSSASTMNSSASGNEQSSQASNKPSSASSTSLNSAANTQSTTQAGTENRNNRGTVLERSTSNNRGVSNVPMSNFMRETTGNRSSSRARGVSRANVAADIRQAALRPELFRARAGSGFSRSKFRSGSKVASSHHKLFYYPGYKKPGYNSGKSAKTAHWQTKVWR